MGGITVMSVGVFAESATEWSCRINISCTAGPNMNSPSVLACVYIYDTCSSLSFLLSLAGQPQAGPRSWFSEDVGACLKCCFAIWGASTGRRSRREKKIGFGSKKKQLFIWGRKETATPGGKQMHAVSSLSWQALDLPTKKSWKSMSEVV